MDWPSEITVGAAISVLLLAIFVGLNYSFEGLLSLQTQWIALAVVPLIIALFVGDHISYFKGFGIELKSRLDDPVSNYAMPLEESHVAEVPGEEKRSVSYLQGLSSDKKNKIKRITFVESTDQYYTPDAVQSYFDELPNLEYFEVVDNRKHFVCLVPVKAFRNNGNLNHNEINRFTRSIVDGRVLDEYNDVAISDAVDSGQSLISVLSQIRSSEFNIAPVLDEDKKLVGIISQEGIEKEISNAVLSLHNRRGGYSRRA